MDSKNILLAVFLAIVSTNVIQAGLITSLIEEEAIPKFIHTISRPFPEFHRFSENFASSAANAASRAFGHFRKYVGGFRTDLENIDIPERFNFLRRFVDGDILSNFEHPTVGRSSASSAATVSGAGGATDGIVVPRLYRHVLETGRVGSDTASTGSTGTHGSAVILGKK